MRRDTEGLIQPAPGGTRTWRVCMQALMRPTPTGREAAARQCDAGAVAGRRHRVVPGEARVQGGGDGGGGGCSPQGGGPPPDDGARHRPGSRGRRRCVTGRGRDPQKPAGLPQAGSAAEGEGGGGSADHTTQRLCYSSCLSALTVPCQLPGNERATACPHLWGPHLTCKNEC